MKHTGFKKERRAKSCLTLAFAVIAVVYVLPIVIVLMNSFKGNTAISLDAFALPSADSFTGMENYRTGMTFGSYPFLKSVAYSLLITLLSTGLILICTSMAAWYISRVGSRISRLYRLCRRPEHCPTGRNSDFLHSGRRILMD